MSVKTQRVVNYLLMILGIGVFYALKLPLLAPWKLHLCISVVTIVAVVFVMRRRHDRKFHEYRFHPISRSQLNDSARPFFENNSPSMEELGLQLVGDFELEPWPDGVYARVFVSPDGQIIGDLTDRSYGAMQSFSFESVLSDGIYVESAALEMDIPPPDPDIDKMHWENLPGASIAELYRSHYDLLQRLAQDRNCEVISFAPEQFRDVIDYGHRLTNWRLYREGHKTEPPPPPFSATAPECATGR